MVKRRRDKEGGKPRDVHLGTRITTETYNHLFDEMEKFDFYNMPHIYREILLTHVQLMEENNYEYERAFLNVDKKR